MSALRRSKQAVCDLSHHFVWIPRYRKGILAKDVAERAKLVVRKIVEECDMIIDAMELEGDHVHMFLATPQTLWPPRIAQILKSISAREPLASYTGSARSYGVAGYGAMATSRAVGDEVTSQVIRGYMTHGEH